MQRKQGRPLAPLRVLKACTVDGCERTTWLVYCKLHAERVARLGTPHLSAPLTLQERFDAKVDKRHGGCWIWHGAANHLGYGQIWLSDEKRVDMAHRVSLRLVGREIPEGWDVDHLCRTPACVNPDHLEPVTHAENMARAPWSAPEYQRAKRACKYGHPFTPENTQYVNNKSGTRRRCKECRKREAQNRTRKRAGLPPIPPPPVPHSSS